MSPSGTPGARPGASGRGQPPRGNGDRTRGSRAEASRGAGAARAAAGSSGKPKPREDGSPSSGARRGQAPGQRQNGEVRRARGDAPRPTRTKSARTGEPAAPRGARDVALAVLQRVDEGAWANLVLPTALRRSDLSSGDRAAVTDLVYGTVRMRAALDAALAPCSSQDLDRLEPPVLRGLRLGAYELLFARTAAHAAVAETVGAVRRTGGPARAGYVNAVLRTLTKRPPRWPNPAVDPVGWATTRGSHPLWIVRAALARLGAADMVRLVVADNERPLVTLRVTPGRVTVPELLTELSEAGLDAEPTRLSPECVTIAHGDPGAIACVQDGRAVVQDEASALVAPVLGDRLDRGELAADLAAGPGGKAGHLAALGARVLAVERHAARAAKVAETAARIGVADRLQTVVGDGTRPPLAPGTVAGVLVDAPCTNLGSLRRRPEARWRHEEQEMTDLVRLQGQLLDAAALAVRPGGSVVYSVCTWTRQETDEVVDAALARLPLVPAPLGGALGSAPRRQLWPHEDGMDGIFVAHLVRTS